MEYWFLLPLGALLAALGMSSGISGSNFWIPVYLLWLGLEPKVAFWVSLLTMLFGFGSGVVRNLIAGTIRWQVVRPYAAVALPATVVGALTAARAAAHWLLLAFAGFALAYGAFLIVEFLRSRGRAAPPAAGRRVHRPVAAVAGFLQGGIATGSGTLLLPCLLRDERVEHPSEAVGSTVVLVFSCSLAAVCFRVDAVLFAALTAHAEQILAIMLFAAPGVVLGGQLGPRIAQRLPRQHLRLYVGALLLGVGALVAARGWSGLGS